MTCSYWTSSSVFLPPFRFFLRSLCLLSPCELPVHPWIMLMGTKLRDQLATAILSLFWIDPFQISHPSSKVSSLGSFSCLLQLRVFLIYSKSNNAFWGIAHWALEHCLCCLSSMVMCCAFQLDCQLLTTDWELIVTQQTMNKWVRNFLCKPCQFEPFASYTQFSTT